MTPAEFGDALRTYCETLGGSVTSWGRTVAHNAAVGGDPRSLHLAWRAADVVYDTRPPIERAQDVASMLGLKVYREGDHDHLRVADRAWA